MADDYIAMPVDGAGKKSQTKSNIIGVNTVHTEAVYVTDGLGAEITTFPVSGTVGISEGTLTNLMGGTIQVGYGTVGVKEGTLNYISDLGTCFYLNGMGMGTIRVESGTVGVSMGTIIPAGLGTVRVDMGTIGISEGTVIVAGLGTVRVDMGTIGVSAGTLQNLGTCYYVTGLGMGTVRVESGTIIPSGLGTIRVDMGTIGVNMGTLQQLGTLFYQNNLGTCYYLTGMGMGTVRVEYGTVNVGGLGTVAIGFGTIAVSGGTFDVQGTVVAEITEGTLTAIGSVSTYSKHDLHDYHALGTYYTDIGTVVQTAGKVIKVHHYRANTDGTWNFSFVDNKDGGGTLDFGWPINQREGVTTCFAPYPAYLLKTTTAGSALFLGTWPAVPCNGTLRLSLIYTDDDAS